MVAFSCCVYDGGKKEYEDMNTARERGWKGKFTRPGRVITPGAYRINGKCPLTPLEVILVIISTRIPNHMYSTSINDDDDKNLKIMILFFFLLL